MQRPFKKFLVANLESVFAFFTKRRAGDKRQPLPSIKPEDDCLE